MSANIELATRLEDITAELTKGEPVMFDQEGKTVTAGDLLTDDADLPGLWNILNGGCC